MGTQPRLPRTGRAWGKLVAGILLALLIVAGLGLAGISWWVARELDAATGALDRHRAQQALTHLQQVLRVSPRNDQAHLLAARASRLAGSLADADRHLANLKELVGSRDDRYRFESLLLRAQRGEAREVETQLHATLEQDVPEVALVLEALGRGYVLLREYHTAWAHVDRWAQQQAENPQAHFHRGLTAFRLDRVDQAILSFRRAIELEPELLSARVGLAEIFVKQGECEAAAPHLEFCHERDPSNVRVCKLLVQCYLENRASERARLLVAHALKLDPNDLDILLGKGQLFLLEKNWAEAIATFLRLLEVAPGHGMAHFHLSKVLRRVGRAAEAEKHEAAFKKYDEDLRHLEAITKEARDNPGNADLHYRAGALLLKGWMTEQAMAAFATALEKNPTHEPTHRALAEFYSSKGNVHQADYHRRKLRVPPPAPGPGPR